MRNDIKHSFDTDFSILSQGSTFPSAEVYERNKVYRHNMRLFTGEYAKNKRLCAVVDGTRQEIDYSQLPLNYFELTANKMYSLLMDNDIDISVGDIEKDKLVGKLIERTRWLSSAGEAIKIVEICGDVAIKTYRNGMSVIEPTKVYKVVDIHDKKNVIGYVAHEFLYEKEKLIPTNNVRYKIKYIRILVSCKGFEYERVFEYTGTTQSGVIGKPVRYKYKDRWIPKSGRYYYTGIDDATTIQWLSVNTEKNGGVYGASCFDNIKELVFALETRLSTENWVVDNHGKPLLVVGQQSLKTNEATGEYELSVINGKYLLNKSLNGTDKPEYLEFDGKLDNSKQIRDDIRDIMYDLTEMGKTFLSGTYTGNVSEESLNNMIKSALSRGQRDADSIVHQLKNSLYVLCRLNDIDVKLEDINIVFNIGRVDDTKVITEVCEKLDSIKLMSKETLLTKFFGYNTEDAKSELERVRLESNVNINNVERVDISKKGGIQ